MVISRRPTTATSVILLLSRADIEFNPPDTVPGLPGTCSWLALDPRSQYLRLCVPMMENATRLRSLAFRSSTTISVAHGSAGPGIIVFAAIRSFLSSPRIIEEQSSSAENAHCRKARFAAIHMIRKCFLFSEVLAMRLTNALRMS